MKEKLYTVPVNDAFDAQSECPLCTLRRGLERHAIEFVLGPSYMEDDVRTKTNELGFCREHLTEVLGEKNRLGLAMILKTHLDRQISTMEPFAKTKIKPKNLLKEDPAAVSTQARVQARTCYVCARVDAFFPHYLDTILHLYKHEPDFRKKYEAAKGFCGEHLADLVDEGRKRLRGEELQTFYETTMNLYLTGIRRVRDDLEWFAQKFDYRFRDEPWKESKDSIERASVKTNGILKE